MTTAVDLQLVFQESQHAESSIRRHRGFLAYSLSYFARAVCVPSPIHESACAQSPYRFQSHRISEGRFSDMVSGADLESDVVSPSLSLVVSESPRSSWLVFLDRLAQMLVPKKWSRQAAQTLC